MFDIGLYWTAIYRGVYSDIIAPQITGPPLSVRYGEFRATIHWAVGRLAAGSRGVSKIGCYADRIALKFDRHSGSTADVPVKFQSDWRNLTPNPAASRPLGVPGWGIGPLLMNGGPESDPFCPAALSTMLCPLIARITALTPSDTTSNLLNQTASARGRYLSQLKTR